MPASDMTIVHLSEFHLQPADKAVSGVPYQDLLDGYEDALRTLDHLRRYVRQPDLVVVTGDLVLGSRNAEAGYPRLNELLEQFRAEFDVPILLALGKSDAPMGKPFLRPNPAPAGKPRTTDFPPSPLPASSRSASAPEAAETPAPTRCVPPTAGRIGCPGRRPG